MLTNTRRAFCFHFIINSLTGIMTIFFSFLVAPKHTFKAISLDYLILFFNFGLYFLVGFLLKKPKRDMQDFFSVFAVSMIGISIAIWGLYVGHGVINEHNAIWGVFGFYNLFAAPALYITPAAHGILLVVIASCAPATLMWAGMRYKMKLKSQRNQIPDEPLQENNENLKVLYMQEKRPQTVNIRKIR